MSLGESLKRLRQKIERQPLAVVERVDEDTVYVSCPRWNARIAIWFRFPSLELQDTFYHSTQRTVQDALACGIHPIFAGPLPPGGRELGGQSDDSTEPISKEEISRLTGIPSKKLDTIADLALEAFATSARRPKEN